jgi:hypothetical protein
MCISTMIIISCPCTISLWSCGHHSLPHTPSSHVLLMPNSKHSTHGISNLVSLITKTKLGLSVGPGSDRFNPLWTLLDHVGPSLCGVRWWVRRPGSNCGFQRVAGDRWWQWSILFDWDIWRHGSGRLGRRTGPCLGLMIPKGWARRYVYVVMVGWVEWRIYKLVGRLLLTLLTIFIDIAT